MVPFGLHPIDELPGRQNWDASCGLKADHMTFGFKSEVQRPVTKKGTTGVPVS